MTDNKRGFRLSKSFIRNVKAQVTIFIIIGVIILFSTAIVMYVKNQAIKYRPPISEVVEQVPVEFQPIQTYIKNCVEQVGEDAVQKIGMSGYINYSKINGIIINPSSSVESDAVELIPGSNIQIPYWWYLKSKSSCTNGCQFESLRPVLYKGQGRMSMEEQISGYVQDNIKSCLQNFQQFRSAGFKFEEVRAPAITTQITETGVDLLLDYPLKITYGDSIQTISKFYNTVDVNLNKIYNLATEITNLETKNNFLEVFTLNLISSYQGASSDRLPPLADYDTTCKQGVSWLKTDVIENMVTPMLLSYIPMIKVVGSANFQRNIFDSSLKQALYDQMYTYVYPVDAVLANGIDINFNYIGWPIYGDISPNKGGLIMPSTSLGMNFPKIHLCFKEYRFGYDLAYPVVVELKDPAALNGKGYTFYFALESNIRRNQPLALDLNTSLQDAVSHVDQTPMFCDADKRDSGDITVDVSDAETQLPVKNAQVQFCIPGADGSCSDASCNMGITSISGNKAVLKSNFPTAAGLLIVSKDGYVTQTYSILTEFNTSQKIHVDLTPYANVNVKLMKKTFTSELKVVKDSCDKDINSYPWVFPPFSSLADGNITKSLLDSGNVRYGTSFKLTGLESDEQVSIVITRNDLTYEPYSSIVTLNGDVSQTIQLVPGNYTATIELIKSKQLVIPEETICTCDSLLGNTGCEIGNSFKYDKINQTTLDSVSLGGEKVNFTVSRGDAYRGKPLTFYLIAPDFAGFKSLASLSMMERGEDLGNAYIEDVRPSFS